VLNQTGKKWAGSDAAQAAVVRIGELQDLHETTGVSTLRQINEILAALSTDDMVDVGLRLKALGIARSILSGRTMRKARQADNIANTVIYGKNAAGVSDDAL